MKIKNQLLAFFAINSFVVFNSYSQLIDISKLNGCYKYKAIEK